MQFVHLAMCLLVQHRGVNRVSVTQCAAQRTTPLGLAGLCKGLSLWRKRGFAAQLTEPCSCRCTY